MEESAQVEYPEQGSGGGKFLKIVLIVFALAILVLASEFAYVTFSSRSQEPPSPTDGAQPQTDESTLNFGKAARFRGVLEYLEENDGSLINSKIDYTVRGTFVSVVPINWQADGIRYSHEIKLENLGREVSFLYTPQEIAGAEILLMAPEGNLEIDLTQIEAGDSLTIRESVDLLDLGDHSKLLFEVRR